MKILKFLCIIAAIGMSAYWLSTRTSSDQNSSAFNLRNSQLEGSLTAPLPEPEAIPASTQPTREKTPHEEFLKDQARREHDISVVRYESAIDSSRRNVKAFGENGPYLRKKFASQFVEWGLNGDQQDRVIHILQQMGLRSGEELVRSNTSWPAEVGHASNRKKDTEHTLKKVRNLEHITNEALEELSKIVSPNTARELVGLKPLLE